MDPGKAHSGFCRAGAQIEPLLQPLERALEPLNPVSPTIDPIDNSEVAAADETDQEAPMEADEEELNEEEAFVAKPLRSPTAPTAAERAAHAPNHLPYRSWCEHCVAGRRDNPPHKAVECGDNSVPEVIMDYCYVRREDEEETITMMVLKERQSKALQAWVTPTKSTVLDEGAVAERAAASVRRFGHKKKVLLKVDNEAAILAMRELVTEKLGMETLEQEPQPHESQSNGAVENGVRLIKGLLRVHVLALEHKLGHRVPSKHPLMTWLVEHVADVVTKYLRGSDGRTAYERLFGKQIHEEGLEFGERVLWKKRPSNDSNVLLEARWVEGLWLGRAWGTPHHRIGNSESVWTVRAVQRCPESHRWRPDLLEAIRATPWQNPARPLGTEAPEVLPPLPADQRAPAHVPDEAGRALKNVYIRPIDLDIWGYTSSCGKCQKTRQGLPVRGMRHTIACRTRIELAMAEADDPRWRAAADRIAQRMAEDDATRVPVAMAAAVPDTPPPPSLPPPQEDPATPVLTEEDAVFQQVFAEAESESGSALAWLPVDHSENARMDLYNNEDLEDWPAGPAEDYMGALLALSISPAERREANEIVELFLTVGTELHAARAKVAELYSPPRVTAELPKLPHLMLSQGRTFDLRQDRHGRKLNFLLEADRAEAKRLIQEEKPFIVIGSPPCTSFCTLNRRFNYRRMDPERVRQMKHEGDVLLKFALEIYEVQVAAGRHFLHEHPASAVS